MENQVINQSEKGSFKSKINLKQVIIFILLTFGLTWLLDFLLYLNGGLDSPVTAIALQFQMLIPAFAAMVLGVFFFKDSPLYKDTNRSSSRWFVNYFMCLTILYAAAVVLSFLKPDLVTRLITILYAPNIFGLLLLIILRLRGGKDSYTSVNITGGKVKNWLLYGSGLLLLIGLQNLLNWIFKFGQPVSNTMLEIQAASTGMPYFLWMGILALSMIVLGPFLGLLISFGEEYGWRGYLQPALTRIGRIKGVLISGFIWGVWHLPIIWMGYNYPGQPVLGSLLMVLFCIALAFILGYAVLKTKSIWLCAFLHALLNQSFSYFFGFIYSPNDVAFSFGMGLPGLAVFGLLILFILRDPLWKQQD